MNCLNGHMCIVHCNSMCIILSLWERYFFFLVGDDLKAIILDRESVLQSVLYERFALRLACSFKVLNWIRVTCLMRHIFYCDHSVPYASVSHCVETLFLFPVKQSYGYNFNSKCKFCTLILCFYLMVNKIAGVATIRHWNALEMSAFEAMCCSAYSDAFNLFYFSSAQIHFRIRFTWSIRNL